MIELNVFYVCDRCGKRAEAVTVPKTVTWRLLAFPRGETLSEAIYAGGPTGWMFWGEQLICNECNLDVRNIVRPTEPT